MKKVILLMTLFLLSFVLASCSDNNEMSGDMGNEMGEMSKNISNSDKIVSKLVITKNNINLGIIPMDEGKVNISFEIINMGTNDVILGKSETSCMCTEGFITDANGGEKSGRIKMAGHAAILDLKRVIKPGEKLYLIGVYDPNAHGPDATGPIARDIFINTNSSSTPKLDFKFFGEVVKTRINKASKNISEIKKEDTSTQKLNTTAPKTAYNPITSKEFDEMNQNKDFVLIDTHIPEQTHIKGTDSFIPFNDIENNLNKLPSDKNTKIVVYCAGGGMSKIAANKLIKMGYTNIYDLMGGKYGYDSYMNK